MVVALTHFGAVSQMWFLQSGKLKPEKSIIPGFDGNWRGRWGHPRHPTPLARRTSAQLGGNLKFPLQAFTLDVTGRAGTNIYDAKYDNFFNSIPICIEISLPCFC